MGKVIKCVKYDDFSIREEGYNNMHNKLVYEVEYLDGTLEQIMDNIIA